MLNAIYVYTCDMHELDMHMNRSLLLGRKGLDYYAHEHVQCARRVNHTQLPPLPNRWHVTTQQRLFAHLREAWPRDDVPRVMVDLGCQAGHGESHNVSDALLWLQRFHSDGSLVYGVDAIEE